MQLVDVPKTEDFIPIDGDMNIHIVVYGNPHTATRATVAIHGMYQTLDCWKHQQTLATYDHVLVCLDLPYHGATSLPPSFTPSIDIWTRSIRAVLEHLHLVNTPHILMGWSFGSWCIQQYLIEYGIAHVEGIILVSGLFGDIQEYFPILQQETPETLETLSTLTDASNADDVLRATQQFVTLLRKRYPDVSSYDETLGWNIRSVSKVIQAKINPFALLGASVNADIKRISASIIAAGLPVLLMVGKQDVVLPIATLPIARGAFPHAKVVTFESCGHMCFSEYPEQFNAEVRLFREFVG